MELKKSAKNVGSGCLCLEENGRGMGVILFCYVLGYKSLFIWQFLWKTPENQSLSSWLLEFMGADGIEELLSNAYVLYHDGEIKIQHALRKIQVIIIRIK